MMAPEFHNGHYLKGYAFEVDYYSLGMLLFELAVGKAPFGYAKQNESLEEDIKAGISQETLDQVEDLKLRALCAALLQKEPGERLSEMKRLKEHEFFRDQVDWQDVADFAQMDGERPSEEERDLLDFFGHKYNLGFYGEDVEQIDHFTFGSLLSSPPENVIDTFTL